MTPDGATHKVPKRICVFAGSSPGLRPAYRSAAGELGRTLASNGIGLVYGGARVGLMGATADAALAAGGEVIGVIPAHLVAREVAHAGLSDLRIVASMHERKSQMADLSDAFVALPGGLGTWEEFFEVLTWAQLGLHRKPCGLLNVEGYFNPLLAFLNHAIAEGFVQSEYRAMVVVAETADAMLDALTMYEPPTVEKWLDSTST